MEKNKTPAYISNLLKPMPSKGADRWAWSIPLQGVWLPFFTATNVTGETVIPQDALGAPLRLAHEKDGSVKFSQSGRPVFKIARELSDQIRIVRENFVAGLVNYAGTVARENPDGYKAEVEVCRQAGAPHLERARQDIEAAVARAEAAVQAEAQPQAEKSPKPRKKEKVAVAA